MGGKDHGVARLVIRGDFGMFLEAYCAMDAGIPVVMIHCSRNGFMHGTLKSPGTKYYTSICKSIY